MSFKSGYFCGFCQKEGCLSYNLQDCERCEIAIYCEDNGANAKKCKDQDWENHKSICGKVAYLQSLIPRIERNFYDFNLRSVPDEGIRSSSSHVFTILDLQFFSRNLSRSAHTNNQYESRIFTMNFYQVKVLN